MADGQGVPEDAGENAAASAVAPAPASAPTDPARAAAEKTLADLKARINDILRHYSADSPQYKQASASLSYINDMLASGQPIPLQQLNAIAAQVSIAAAAPGRNEGAITQRELLIADEVAERKELHKIETYAQEITEKNTHDFVHTIAADLEVAEQVRPEVEHAMEAAMHSAQGKKDVADYNSIKPQARHTAAASEDYYRDQLKELAAHPEKYGANKAQAAHQMLQLGITATPTGRASIEALLTPSGDISKEQSGALVSTTIGETAGLAAQLAPSLLAHLPNPMQEALAKKFGPLQGEAQYKAVLAYAENIPDAKLSAELKKYGELKAHGKHSQMPANEMLDVAAASTRDAFASAAMFEGLRSFAHECEALQAKSPAQRSPKETEQLTLFTRIEQAAANPVAQEKLWQDYAQSHGFAKLSKLGEKNAVYAFEQVNHNGGIATLDKADAKHMETMANWSQQATGNFLKSSYNEVGSRLDWQQMRAALPVTNEALAHLRQGGFAGLSASSCDVPDSSVTPKLSIGAVRPEPLHIRLTGMTDLYYSSHTPDWQDIKKIIGDLDLPKLVQETGDKHWLNESGKVLAKDIANELSQHHITADQIMNSDGTDVDPHKLEKALEEIHKNDLPRHPHADVAAHAAPLPVHAPHAAHTVPSGPSKS
jgi:hypothetical protein